MLTRQDVHNAATRIAGHIRRTPVFTTDAFGPTITFKLEHLQHTGSFKARGAINALLSMDVPVAGLVAASGGNHGAAVAWAAHRLGHRARIYVPEIAGPSKIQLIESLGADLVVVPGAYANAMEQALDWEQRTGAAQIHAYDAPATLAGQGTMMLELEQQTGHPATTLIAVGGGGLIGGAMLASDATIIGVEPEQAATLTNALAHGPDTQTDVGGIAANALGARVIGRHCYDLALSRGLQTITVPDDAIATAQRALWSELRLLVEPAGATALAAVLCGAFSPPADTPLNIILCGGNIAPSPL